MEKLLIFVTLLLLLTACGTSDQEPTDSSEAIDQTLITANNQLGFNFLKTVEPDSEGNRFVSPTSLLMALSMVYNGADGETKQEIAQTLQLNEIDVEELNKANALMMEKINDDARQVELNIANSIWLNNDFRFQSNFAENTQHYFKAEIEEIDVTDDRSVDQINEWVRQATNDKIDHVANAPLDPKMVTMLINAVKRKAAVSGK